MKKISALAVLMLMVCSVAFADETLKNLYASYGELQIRAEILQGQTMQVKKAIADELQKPPKESGKKIENPEVKK